MRNFGSLMRIDIVYYATFRQIETYYNKDMSFYLEESVQ